MEAMMAGLDDFEPARLPGRVKFEVEVLIMECVTELNRQPVIRRLLEGLLKAPKAQVTYTPGQEGRLRQVVGLLHKAINESTEQREEAARQEKRRRKAELEQKGLGYLRAGDAPRGKAAMRVLAEEFGQEPGVYAQVGEWLLEFDLHFEAAEVLEQAMEAFPKESKAYGLAAQCYRTMREFAKAETVYLHAIKQFGKHPRTVLNLAKLYMEWNRKEDAFRMAQDALNKDQSLDEARAIVEKYA